MAIVWITSAVLLLVITPVVIKLLSAVKRPVVQIRRQSEQLLAAAPTLTKNLDSVGKLPKTKELGGQTSAGVARYGGAVDRILG